MIWVWKVTLPLTVSNSPNVTWFNQPDFGTGRNIAGVILYAIGRVSDIRKFRLRTRHGSVYDNGVFYQTRHPNYFGEIMIQFCKTLLILQ